MNLDKFYDELKAIFKMKDLPPLETELNDLTDSLGRAEIIICAEEQLGYQLSDEKIVAMKTFGDLLQAVGISAY